MSALLTYETAPLSENREARLSTHTCGAMMLTIAGSNNHSVQIAHLSVEDADRLLALLSDAVDALAARRDAA